MSTTREYRTEDQRWIAVKTRDQTANSAFIYGATTTRIFCRPTCLGRVARRANTIFFDDAESAKNYGYRACMRCKPEDHTWNRESTAVDILTRGQYLLRQAMLSGEPWTVQQIAGETGVTAAHFHRIFKRHLNMTPKDYVAQIAENRSTTNASESLILMHSTVSGPDHQSMVQELSCSTVDTYPNLSASNIMGHPIVTCTAEPTYDLGADLAHSECPVDILWSDYLLPEQYEEIDF